MADCGVYVVAGPIFGKDENDNYFLVTDAKTRRRMLWEQMESLEQGIRVSFAFPLVREGIIKVDEYLLGVKPRCYIGDRAFGWLYAYGDLSFDVVMDIEGCNCSEEKWLFNPNAAWKVYDRKQWGVAEEL